MTVEKHKITITFEAIADKEEIETAIERDIVDKVYQSIWNVSNFEAKVMAKQNEDDFVMTHSFGTLKDMGGLEWQQ